MSIESARNQKEDRNLEIFTERIRRSVEQALIDIPDTLDLENQKKQLLTKMTERLPEILPGHAVALSRLLGELDAISVTSRQELEEQVTPRLVSFFTNVMPLEELQTLLSGYWAKYHGRVNVNDALSYDLDNPTEIHIHVATLFTLSPSETIKHFEEGLHQLALRLQTDSNLAQINLISGHSWIVYKHPGLIERLGFMISDKDDETGQALASMSRDEFLKRYLNEGSDPTQK